jgi:hypothetical protein
MKFTPSSLPDSWNEVDRLISLLRSWGINYLVGLDHTASSSNLQTETSPVVLIQCLARCDEYPRVRDASISANPASTTSSLSLWQMGPVGVARIRAKLSRSSYR